VKVTREKTENCQAFLTIEMEPAEVEESLEKSYADLVKKTHIPGFRKGKAPRTVLEQHIGKDKLLEDALNNLIPQAYEKAVEEQKIEPIARSAIELVQAEPLIFKAIVPLKPTIKLGDYHIIKATQEPVQLSDENIDAVVEQLRHRHATWEPVERAVDYGDLVVLDVVSNVDGVPFMNQKVAQYQVQRDLSYPAPGFAEQLIGMQKGEEKEFKLQLPPDYPREDLAGKEPWFKIKVGEIKQEILPELDNDFAKLINPDFKDLNELREKISVDLKHRAEENAKIDFEERIIGELADQAEIEFPPILAEIEIDWLIGQQLRQWRMIGKGLEDYLKSLNKTEEELREELRPAATKRVRQLLALSKLAEEEKIEVSDAEVDAEIEEILKSVKENKEQAHQSLNTPDTRNSIAQSLLNRKTVQRLAEIASEKSGSK
jgi:trigger factor